MPIFTVFLRDAKTRAQSAIERVYMNVKFVSRSSDEDDNTNNIFINYKLTRLITGI